MGVKYRRIKQFLRIYSKDAENLFLLNEPIFKVIGRYHKKILLDTIKKSVSNNY